MDPWLQAIVEIIKILGTLGATWLAAIFAIHKFHKEKEWERKELAYTALLEALYTFRQIADDMPYVDDNEAEIDEEERLEKTGNSLGAFRKVVETGGWYVSPEIVNSVRKLWDGYKHTMTKASWDSRDLYVENWTKIAEMSAVALSEVRGYAVSELQSRKWWRFWE